MASAVGAILREWRSVRGMSQLDLAGAAEVSARHLSFVETGRAEPSREMVLQLARALDVPFRERNSMLTAAGYAPVYRETALDDPAMAEMRHAVELLLRQHEPFSAVAFDRRWDLLICNAPYAKFLSMLPEPIAVEPYRVLPAPRPNVLKLLLGPMRPLIVNFDEVARAMLDRAQREALADRDPVRRKVVEECLAMVPEALRATRPEQPLPLVLAVELALGDRRARLFTTITTLGTPQDITLQELRIETFHPADAATEALARALAGT